MAAATRVQQLLTPVRIGNWVVLGFKIILGETSFTSKDIFSLKITFLFLIAVKIGIVRIQAWNPQSSGVFGHFNSGFCCSTGLIG